jgi:hypothetical protein
MFIVTTQNLHALICPLHHKIRMITDFMMSSWSELTSWPWLINFSISSYSNHRSWCWCSFSIPIYYTHLSSCEGQLPFLLPLLPKSSSWYWLWQKSANSPMPVGPRKAAIYYSGMGTMTLQSFIKHGKIPLLWRHLMTSYKFLT